jgi:hypothetical protein
MHQAMHRLHRRRSRYYNYGDQRNFWMLDGNMTDILLYFRMF